MFARFGAIAYLLDEMKKENIELKADNAKLKKDNSKLRQLVLAAGYSLPAVEAVLK